MLYVYIVAIIAFLAIVVISFYTANKKDQQRMAKLLSAEAEVATLNVPLNEVQSLEKTEEKVDVAEVSQVEIAKINAQFEDFSLDQDNEEVETFAVDDLTDNDDLDRKFAEYQKFLRENLDLGDNDKEDNYQSIDSMDFDDLMDNSPDKVASTIQAMSPEARNLLLTNVLARKNFDEDEEN